MIKTTYSTGSIVIQILQFVVGNGIISQILNDRNNGWIVLVNNLFVVGNGEEDGIDPVSTTYCSRQVRSIPVESVLVPHTYNVNTTVTLIITYHKILLLHQSCSKSNTQTEDCIFGRKQLFVGQSWVES